jgi:hypothetical protein
MKKHEAGKGGYGYSYENQVPSGPGKSEWHKFVFWFESHEQRDIAMNTSKATIGSARKFRKVGR